MWGDPIAHSKSPQLHRAAYEVLGLDWEYDRRQVGEAEFDSVLHGLDGTWRGLSLTMPLKDAAFRAADERDQHAQITGVANTLRLGERVLAFNTDVGGIIDALAENGITAVERVRLIGAGATAASALVAVRDLGATHVEVRTRRPGRAGALIDLGERLGVRTSADVLDGPVESVDLTVASLPGGTVLDESLSHPLGETGGPLFDVAYSPWPSALAASWSGGSAISGLGMLLHQAVRQIRIFVHGDPSSALPDESAVIAAMRAAL